MKFLILLGAIAMASAVDFEIQNNLPGAIWVGILGNGGKAPLANGGFVLEAYASRTVSSDDQWAGRFWARTWCDPNTQHCQTGDCGNRLECAGNGGAPPVSLAEITLRGWQGQDFYDISLVDGYNVKASIEPINGNGDCKAVRCATEINDICPDDLKQAGGDHGEYTVACFSSCAKYNTDEYCCRGNWGLPTTCDPNTWAVNSATVFKQACPDAYSYAYDDLTSTFTCVSNHYKVTFG
ncbi:uncharacterized protein [Atheta coriaria]|uniref:uncharacterized protein n=1 Tax=Dalotia coriaria TaxID=877792 RepID=UPI0031F41825